MTREGWKRGASGHPDTERLDVSRKQTLISREEEFCVDVPQEFALGPWLVIGLGELAAELTCLLD